MMKKIRMCVDTDKTFAEGFEEYILDCKSRNLRDGTLRHYRESIKQIYKRVPPDTLISDLDEYTMPLLYKCTGARDMVTPTALMMPAASSRRNGRGRRSRNCVFRVVFMEGPSYTKRQKKWLQDIMEPLQNR